MSFTIAIAGRPNVGKSTLFNRLAGRRLALVDPLPGLTRDRREADIDLFGHPVRLIDTAGLEEAVAGSLSARMRDQTEQAVAEADLVLFVIDARAGVTPDDERFAEVVRRSSKPVLLVVNKCEGKAGEPGFYEAYGLGLGEPIAISAEHGEGISDLVAELMAAAGGEAGDDGIVSEGQADAFDEESAEGDGTTSRPVRIAVVGRPNAGKSTLVNAILGVERMLTGPEPGLTRDSISVDLDFKGRAIRLYDTAGLRKKARIDSRAEGIAVSDALRAIRFAEVVILLIDAEQPLEKQDLTIGDLVSEEGRAMVIGVNKWDLIEDKQKSLKAIREAVARDLPQVKGISVLPVSARSGKGIDLLLTAALETHRLWNRRIATAALNKWLIAATETHAPPAASGRPIRLRFMTQPSTRPPSFVAFCSKPDALPKSYVRYLVNGLREAFDLPGVPLRLALRKGSNPYDRREGRK